MGDVRAASRKKWRYSHIANGRCGRCGKPRGNDGTTLFCRLHADTYAAEMRKYRATKRTSMNGGRQL